MNNSQWGGSVPINRLLKKNNTKHVALNKETNYHPANPRPCSASPEYFISRNGLWCARAWDSLPREGTAQGGGTGLLSSAPHLGDPMQHRSIPNPAPVLRRGAQDPHPQVVGTGGGHPLPGGPAPRAELAARGRAESVCCHPASLPGCWLLAAFQARRLGDTDPAGFRAGGPQSTLGTGSRAGSRSG